VNEACRALDGLETEYETIARRVGAATWTSYVGAAAGETPEDPAAVRREFGPLFARGEPLVDACAADNDGDAIRARRIELWRRCARAWKLDADPEAVRLRVDLEKRVNEHAFERDGTTYSRSDLSRMSRGDDPVLRRRVVELRNDLHRAVLEDTMKLVGLRKSAAAALGPQTYADVMLDAQGVPPAMLDPLFEMLESRTRAAWDDVLRRGREAAGVGPATPLAVWDVQWVIDKLGAVPDERWPKERAVPALVETLRGIGIDFDSLPIRRVEGDFGYGGQTLAVSIPDDVRMMVNPLPGWRTWGILFHETGHALQAIHTTTANAMLKGYEWLGGASAPAYSEGMAELLGLLFGDRAFLERYTDLSCEEIDRFLALWRARALLSIRSHLVDVALERALYAEGSDIDGLERTLTGRYLGVERPDEAPTAWAATAYLAAYPCYMQNYVLADLVAAQILQAVRERFGEDWLENPEVGPYLAAALWADGETREWTDRVREATGAELSAGAYLALLGIP
jgi:hypothetical protein